MTASQALARAAATVRINLLPAPRIEKSKLEEMIRAAAFAGAVLLLIAAGVSAGHWMKSRRLAAQLGRKEAKLQDLKKIVVQVQSMESLENKVKERLSVIKGLAQGRSLYPIFLSDLVKSVPIGIQLRSLQTTGGGSRPGPVSVKATAVAHSNSDIAVWMSQMAEVRKFSSFKLGSVTAQAQGYHFSLEFDYAPAL